jgi:ParB/RepB/Spo0J family partition protein
MSKEDKFAQLDDLSHFTATDAIDAFASNEDPERIGRTTLTNFARLDLEQIITKEQVRTEYDEEKHRELVALLESQGQLQPIVVWWSAEDQKYVVFMGHRRRRAAPEAGFTSLECVILSEPPSEIEKIEKQLAENEGREDLNPIDVANAYAKIQEARGCSERQLAQEMGVSRTELKRLLLLRTLPANLQQAVVNGELPKRNAAEIAALPTQEEQQQAFSDYQAGATFGQLAERAKKSPAKSTSRAKPKTKKEFTFNGIKVVATAKKKFTKADLAAVMRLIQEECESDGRSNTSEPKAGNVAA